jgi:twinkle protein
MRILNEIGITLNNYSIGNHKTFCPKCKHTRKSQNRFDTPLSVTIDSEKVLYKCHNCDYQGIVSEKTNYKVMPKIKKETTSKLFDWFNKRGISQKTVEDLGIYESNGSICFPYIQDNQTVNVKYRTYDKRFKQQPNAQRTLYNIDNVKKYWERTGKKNLIICEGEMDVIAFYEAGVINAVTLPDGAPKEAKFDLKDLRFQALKNCKWLNDVDKVYIATDQDDAGKALHLELVHRFGKDRCLQVKFPNQAGDVATKDANECLLHLGRNTLIDSLKQATPYPIQGIYTVRNYKKEIYDIYEGNIQKPLSTGFKILDTIYKIQPATFHVVTGVPNHGKSNFIDQIAVNLFRNENWKFCIFSPEHSTPQHIRRIVEKIVKKPFDDGYYERMSKDELTRGMKILNENFYFIENKDNIPSIDWILSKAKQSVLKFGIKGIIIDPYNEINSTREGNKREDEHIRDVISKCKRFCRTHEITMWMVAHPNKLPRKEDGSIAVPTMYDVSGSAHWNNMADVGLVVHRNFDTQKTRVITRKIREQGLYGNIGECFFEYDLKQRVYKEVIKESKTQETRQYWYND